MRLIKGDFNMAKNIDKIIKNVEHNLNKASIKEANGLSSIAEEKALVNNLNDIFDSDYWQECQETMDKLHKEAMELYPEYFTPIVAKDPLVVVYERIAKLIDKYVDSIRVIKSSSGNKVIKDNAHYNVILQVLLNNISEDFYLEIDENDYSEEEKEIFSKEVSSIKDLRDEIKLFISKYNDSNTEKNRVKYRYFICADLMDLLKASVNVKMCEN